MNMWSQSVIVAQEEEVFEEILKTNDSKDVQHH